MLRGIDPLSIPGSHPDTHPSDRVRGFPPMELILPQPNKLLERRFEGFVLRFNSLIAAQLGR